MLTRRSFFGSAYAAAVIAATRYPTGLARTPRLKVGVIADIHLLTANDHHWHSDETYEKALRFFDGKGVDAVLLCGDIADCGLVAELELAADIWNKVFSQGKRRDGGRVQPLFIMGDHDLGGFAHKYYWARECSRSPDEVSHVIVKEDFAAHWKRIFGEEWKPIQVKTVKGYTFVLAHHPANVEDNALAGSDSPGTAIPGLAEALAAANIPTNKPFFYAQHRPIYGTMPDFSNVSLEKDPNYMALAAYPNAMAFFGHTHRNCADERSLWQGAFTSINCGCARGFAFTFPGRENGHAVTDMKAKTVFQMPPIDIKRIRQGMLMEVFGDRVVFHRREFVYDQVLGPDWVVPLGKGAARPYEFEPRRRASRPPQFAAGASVAVVERPDGRNRKGEACAQVVVSFPSAKGERVFDYEVSAEVRIADFTRTVASKRVFSPDAFLGVAQDAGKVTCVFAKSELPLGREICFAVRPFNCWGKAGEPICSEWIRLPLPAEA